MAPFTDVTQAAGITFVHENGAAGDKLLPETMGGGCALFDYDNDGDVDLLLVNSSRWPWDTRPAPDTPPTLALYRNDGDWKFTDVTQEAGSAVTLYGMGVAVGDFDNDHDTDLFVIDRGAESAVSQRRGQIRRRDRAGGSGRGRRPVEQRLRVARFQQRWPARPVRLQLHSLVARNRFGAGLLAGRDPPRLRASLGLRRCVPVRLPQ